jgi:uncharacterized phosphosugar-binding protein
MSAGRPSAAIGTDLAPGSQRWLASALALLAAFGERESANVEAASRLCAAAIAAGGLVHLFGSGHSRIPVEEMFPRYGSYPGYHPMAELSTSFHTQVVGNNGQRQAMFLERVSGLSETILSNFSLGPPDVMVVFSASGRGAAAVEMAQGARQRGLKVIAVTSLAEAMAEPPTHASDTRMHEHADVVLDLGTPPGDALTTVDGWTEPVGPGSTVINVAAVNCIKVRTAELLAAEGVRLPVITSASLVGAARSDELFSAAYDEHVRRAARVLRGATSAEGAARAVSPEVTDRDREPQQQ